MVKNAWVRSPVGENMLELTLSRKLYTILLCSRRWQPPLPPCAYLNHKSPLDCCDDNIVWGACTGVYKSTPLRDSTWATPTAQLECPGAPRKFASVLNARSRHPCRSSPSHFSLSPGVAPCSIKSLRRFIHPCLKFLLIA